MDSGVKPFGRQRIRAVNQTNPVTDQQNRLGPANPVKVPPAKPVTSTSDNALLDEMRRTGSASVSQLVTATGVTATAVRQRLHRLMASGLVCRATVDQSLSAGSEDSSNRLPKSRGRPSHRYSLTEKGIHQAGTNYADLVMVLWQEIRSIPDPEIKRGLLQRLAVRLAAHYKNSVEGTTMDQRLTSLVGLLAEREVPFEFNQSEKLPVLTALACPYPELAAQDRGVCAMEKMLFSELLGASVQLTSCRLDGASCCTFEPVNS
jgi:DeoR family suf operon transcriptional repressor